MNREALFSSVSSEWETPQSLFDCLNERYHFNLDPASTDENAKCKNHFTVFDNGLNQNWGGYNVWLNPPYGKEIREWVKKAYEEGKKPNTTVVCLLPARTDTAWFHDYCLKGKLEFIRGRLKFGKNKNNAPFPSMIVVFDKED